MTSERSSSILLESGDEEAYPSGYEYVSDEPFGSKRELSGSSPLKEDRHFYSSVTHSLTIATT